MPSELIDVPLHLLIEGGTRMFFFLFFYLWQKNLAAEHSSQLASGGLFTCYYVWELLQRSYHTSSTMTLKQGKPHIMSFELQEETSC